MAEEHDAGTDVEDAREQWTAERTTFQRVYDVVMGTEEYTIASDIADRAACSTTGARDALSQLVEMGVVEAHGDRPTEYRRNESYRRWKRIERLARERTAAELREELDALIEEDESLEERFDAPDPDAVSPAVFEDRDHEAVHDCWEALSRWRTVREDLGVIQRAIHRAERNTDDRTGRSAPA